jgi:hypothetical protein
VQESVLVEAAWLHPAGLPRLQGRPSCSGLPHALSRVLQLLRPLLLPALSCMALSCASALHPPDDPDLTCWTKLPVSVLPHPPASMDLTGVRVCGHSSRMPRVAGSRSTSCAPLTPTGQAGAIPLCSSPPAQTAPGGA